MPTPGAVSPPAVATITPVLTSSPRPVPTPTVVVPTAPGAVPTPATVIHYVPVIPSKGSVTLGALCPDNHHNRIYHFAWKITDHVAEVIGLPVQIVYTGVLSGQATAPVESGGTIRFSLDSACHLGTVTVVVVSVNGMPLVVDPTFGVPPSP